MTSTLGSAGVDPVESVIENMLRGTDLSVEAVMRAAHRAGLIGGVGGVAEAVPTVREFYDVVRSMSQHSNGDEKRGGGTTRAWDPYWRLFVEGYPYEKKGRLTKDGRRVGATAISDDEKLYVGCGHLKLTDVKPSHIKEAQDWAERRALLDNHWKGWRREDKGRAVRESEMLGVYRCFHGALRFFFQTAIGERHVSPSTNPTDSLRKPDVAEGNRRPFTEPEFHDLWSAIISGGHDPELDALLWETVLVTAARREGLINMNLSHLNEARATVRLLEKGGTNIEQPATRELVQRLAAFARSRGATKASDPVFAFKTPSKDGRPTRITDRRFDTMHDRIQRTLPWADLLGVTIHWARHHAIKQVQIIAGDDVAGRYARHANTKTTAVYAKVTGEEVCAAVSRMTGTDHPLSNGGW